MLKTDVPVNRKKTINFIEKRVVKNIIFTEREISDLKSNTVQTHTLILKIHKHVHTHTHTRRIRGFIILREYILTYLKMYDE